MTETEAVVRELELDAAWSASEQMKARNEDLRKMVEVEHHARLEYAIRALGFSRVAAKVQQMRAYDLTHEEALGQIVAVVNETNENIRLAG